MIAGEEIKLERNSIMYVSDSRFWAVIFVVALAILISGAMEVPH